MNRVALMCLSVASRPIFCRYFSGLFISRIPIVVNKVMTTIPKKLCGISGYNLSSKQAKHTSVPHRILGMVIALDFADAAIVAAGLKIARCKSGALSCP